MVVITRGDRTLSTFLYRVEKFVLNVPWEQKANIIQPASRVTNSVLF